ncbi:Gfo/Idh/MocA family oxidoreductase [Alkalihalobacillus sp. FSL R5-0424]
MKLGIIGCGRITEKHLTALAQVPEIIIVALSDLSIERMKQAEALIPSKSSELKLYEDYQQLLQADCDLILVATASGTHVSIARDALKANKHVLVEKPLALSIEESRELRALASSQKRQLFVCHQLRFRKSLHEIKKYIEAGLLGQIYTGAVTMAIQRSIDYYKAAPWRGTWEQDGGMLINQGIHMIDLLCWYLGEVRTVTGQLQWIHTHKETEDVALGIIQFKSGATGLIEANSVTWPKNHGYGLKIFGEKGTIILEGKNYDQLSAYMLESGPSEPEFIDLLSEKNEQTIMYREIVKHLNNETNEAVTADESERALETIFALYQSHKQKSPVTLPLKQFKTIDMKGVTE